MPATVAVLVALWLAPAAEVRAQGPEVDPVLAEGVRLVAEGDFEGAVQSLEAAAGALTRQRGREKVLATAYVYMGVACAALDREAAARERLRAALKADPNLRLPPDQFPAKVIRIFEEIRLGVQAEGKGRAAKRGYLVGGLVAVGSLGGGYVAGRAVLPSEMANRPPVVAVGVEPEGKAIANVTTLRFSAGATDPDGDSLTYSWDFGDGSSATGAATSHVYAREGTFTVGVLVSDGHGHDVSGSRAVTVAMLGGAWRWPLTSTAPEYQTAQNGTTWVWTTSDPHGPSRVAIALRDPRVLAPFPFWAAWGFEAVCEGVLAPDLSCAYLRCTATGKYQWEEICAR